MITIRCAFGLVFASCAGLSCVGGGSTSVSPYGGAGDAGAVAATNGNGPAGTAQPGTAGSKSDGTGGGGAAASDGAGGGSANPNGQSGAGATAGPFMAGARDSHFPLVDRATWVYRHTNPSKTAPWSETDTARATTYMGKPAFVYEDQEDAMGVQTHSTLTIDGTGIYRTYKENTVKGQVVFTVTYEPSFLRYDEAWTQIGQSATLTDNWTQTCVQMSSVSKCAPGAMTPGMTTHTFTVLNPKVSVSVPAGTFDTVEIQRVDPATEETKLMWFAAGVGKVREEVPATRAIEELTSYTIP
jgi:hypothetical protein